MMELTSARFKGCLSKNSYPSRDYAESVMRVEHDKRGVKLRVYPCQFGFHFHLTSKPERVSKSRKQRDRHKLYV